MKNTLVPVVRRLASKMKIHASNATVEEVSAPCSNCHYRYFVGMLTASRLQAHFTPLPYFVRISLGLFAALPVGVYPECMRIAHFCRTAWSCYGLTIHTLNFHQKSNKYAKCSPTFPLKNGLFTFLYEFQN